VQLVRALFHLDISFICWFRLNSPLLCSGVLIAEWVDRAGDKGLGHPQQSMYRHVWRVSLTSVCFIDEVLWVERMKDCLQIPPGEPVCTLLYADLPSAWGSMVSDCIFPCLVWDFFFYLESSFTGDSSEICTRRIWKHSICVSLCSASWGEPGRTAPLPRTPWDM